MNPKDIRTRFTHHPPKTQEDIAAHETVRTWGKHFAATIDELCPEDSREKSLAVTRIEEAVMWANAALARRRAVNDQMDEQSEAQDTTDAAGD